jgi:hypothetical protein
MSNRGKGKQFRLSLTFDEFGRLHGARSTSKGYAQVPKAALVNALAGRLCPPEITVVDNPLGATANCPAAKVKNNPMDHGECSRHANLAWPPVFDLLLVDDTGGVIIKDVKLSKPKKTSRQKSRIH